MSKFKKILLPLLSGLLLITNCLYGVESKTNYAEYTVDNIREKLNEEIEALYGEASFHEKEISDYGSFNQALAQQGIDILQPPYQRQYGGKVKNILCLCKDG